MAPPLAGRPPFATDLPDSVFADPPKPAPRQRKENVDPTITGGARESAYTTFDSYFTGGNGSDPRASGVGDIGRGLMNAGSDYDDSSDDEQPQPKKRTPPAANDQLSDKHRALFAAATGAASSGPPPPSYERGTAGTPQEKPRAHEQPSAVRTVRQPQAVVHAHANDWTISHHAEPSTPPATTGRSMAHQQQIPPPLALQAGGRPVAAPAPRPPQAAFMQGQRPGISPINSSNPYLAPGSIPGSPTLSTRTPQPLPPPQSPIMPIFARPRKESNALTFDEKSGIMRGNSEETLLPRGAGGKGDDFWRRFSMVAKEEAKGGAKKSAWLKKTENGTTRLSTWVWIVGIVFLMVIGGGVGLGWYFSHNKPAQQPVAIGGSANEGFTSASSPPSATPSVRATKVTAAPVPTNIPSNNGRRDGDVPTFVNASVIPPAHRRSLLSRTPH